MRFDHWVSPDGENNWTHSSKIYESSGVFDGTDRRGSTWAPMAVFDKASNHWDALSPSSPNDKDKRCMVMRSHAWMMCSRGQKLDR